MDSAGDVKNKKSGGQSCRGRFRLEPVARYRSRQQPANWERRMRISRQRRFPRPWPPVCDCHRRAAKTAAGLTMTTPFMPVPSCRVHT